MSNLIKKFPEGWTEQNGVRRSSPIQVGEFSSLLKLEFKNRLKFNLLTLKPELDGKEVPETDITFLYVKLGELGWRISREHAKDALFYASQNNCFNPVEEYLLHLEQQEQEGKLYQADINSIATDYLKVDDQLSNKMVKIWLVGQVKRAFERGSKHDFMLVLRSSTQGLGKSSFFKVLMPKEEWFCDTPCHTPKDRLMLIQTCWVYEIAELENLTNKQTSGELKALLSSSVDTFRPPYSPFVIKSPRPSLLVGTANKNQLINDPTGARRFHFLEVKERINLDAIKEDRDAIWLSAIKAYREGFVPILTQEETRISESRNSEYQRENDFYSPLAEWLHTSEPTTPFTTRQALIGAGLKTQYEIPKQQESVLAGDALRSLGYIQKQMRIKKHRDRYWTKEESQEDVPTVPSPGQDDVTANSPATPNGSPTCHNVTTKNRKSIDGVNKPHSAIAGLLSKQNVTPKKFTEKAYTATSSASQPKTSQEEQQKKYKELDEYWNSL